MPSDNAHVHTFAVPAPVTAAQRLQAFDNIADYVVRLPKLFKEEQPRRALSPIITVVDKIGALQQAVDVDPRDQWRLEALDAIEMIVLGYLPSDGPTPAAALKRIEEVVLADRINGAVAHA